MSEEAKNTVPETEQPETAPEEKTAAAAPEQAAAEAATEEDKKKDGGWFNKKAREMEAVKAKLDAAEKNAAQAKDQLLRMAAEYDNYRKRSAKERESIYQDVRADTVTKFLPVYDNLARALEQATCDEAYRKGVEMIMAQLRDILSRMGVTEIESLGQKFDPALHNAVMHEEDDTKGEGEIVQELQRGFKMGDKVIRFAMVKVAN